MHRLHCQVGIPLQGRLSAFHLCEWVRFLLAQLPWYVQAANVRSSVAALPRGSTPSFLCKSKPRQNWHAPF